MNELTFRICSNVERLQLKKTGEKKKRRNHLKVPLILIPKIVFELTHGMIRDQLAYLIDLATLRQFTSVA